MVWLLGDNSYYHIAWSLNRGGSTELLEKVSLWVSAHRYHNFRILRFTKIFPGEVSQNWEKKRGKKVCEFPKLCGITVSDSRDVEVLKSYKAPYLDMPQNPTIWY